MNQHEIHAVAQAITDAHANKPGNDCAGRLDDAKTIIAAFDAIQAHRSRKQAAPVDESGDGDAASSRPRVKGKRE